MLSSSERLRQRVEIMPKIIAPRPLRDSGVFTERRRFIASRRLPGQPRLSGGSNVQPSSEYVVAGIAGCAVCNDRSQITTTTECCPDNYEPLPRPAALLPSCTVCGKASGPQPLPVCCPSNGRVNTWYATDIDPTVFILPTCSPCVVEAQPVPNCCDENGYPLTH